MTTEEYFKQNNLNKNNFNSYQIEEIQEGLKDNLDVSQYSNLKFNWYQMSQIRLGLKRNQFLFDWTKKEKKLKM